MGLDMVRAALIKDGIVVNVAALPDGWPDVANAWTPPEGHEVVISDKAGPGDSYDGAGNFARNERPPEPNRLRELGKKDVLTQAEMQEAIKLLVGSTG